jgi:hypothetical protein
LKSRLPIIGGAFAMITGTMPPAAAGPPAPPECPWSSSTLYRHVHERFFCCAEVNKRKRARVEQCVGWPNENRRVGARYDALATSCLAFLNLAIIRRYLRLLAPDDPSDRA